MQSNNENNEAPYPGFQWDNDHNAHSDLPRYNRPQNDYQPEVNFSPNAYQQEQQQPHYNNAPYAQGNNIYDPVPQPLNNNAQNFGYPSYTQQQGNNDDADYPPPREDNTPYANREDKYKIEDQPNQDNGMNPQTPATIGCNSNTNSLVGRIISVMLLVFVLGNLIILISLLVYHFSNKDVTLTTLAGALSYISFNLEADPILDVQVKDDGTSCPSGYYSMLLGTWPGTVAGCDCPLGLYKRQCSNKKGKDTFCSNIAIRSPIDMYDWGGSKWCIKRAKIGTQYTKSVECGSGFRECSTGICVLSSLSCPVTKVSIQSSGTYKLKVGTNRYVVTENTIGVSPVVDLTITPNDIPCFSDDYQPAGSTSPYKLIDEDEKGCSKYGLDSQYSFQVDIQTQEKLFNQNSFPSKVMNLPDYDDIYENTNSVLSYRKRMNVLENDFCLSIDTDTLEKSSIAAEKLNKFMSGTSITAMVIHAILLLIVSITIFSAKSEGKKLLQALDNGEEIQAWVAPVALIGTLEYITLIVMFAAAKHYRNVMLSAEDYLTKLSETGCFLDSQPKEAVGDYHIAAENVAGSLYKYALALFLITTFSVLPSYYLLCRAAIKK